MTPVSLEATLLAILPGLIKLITAQFEDTYDQEKELEAVLMMQRSLADERVRRALLGLG